MENINFHFRSDDNAFLSLFLGHFWVVGNVSAIVVVHRALKKLLKELTDLRKLLLRRQTGCI